MMTKCVKVTCDICGTTAYAEFADDFNNLKSAKPLNGWSDLFLGNLGEKIPGSPKTLCPDCSNRLARVVINLREGYQR